jgi:mono/diheme cytochrome c family protein
MRALRMSAFVRYVEGGFGEGRCSVQESSNLIPRPNSMGWLLVLGALCLFSGFAAHAQNLDQGKSGPRLFADSCATCHRSPRGLARGRFRFTLFMFLKDH